MHVRIYTSFRKALDLDIKFSSVSSLLLRYTYIRKNSQEKGYLKQVFNTLEDTHPPEFLQWKALRL